MNGPIPSARRVLACLLCAALALGQTPGRLSIAWADSPDAAARPAVEPQQAMAYLQDIGFLRGQEDPLRSYLTDSQGKLSPMGQVVYDYYSLGRTPQQVEALRQDPARAEEWRTFQRDARQRVDDHRQTLQTLRESGPATDRKIEAAQRLVSDVSNVLPGGARGLGAGGDPLAMLAQLNAFYTGSSARDPMSAAYVRQPIADGGMALYDRDGALAFRTDSTGAITFSEDLARSQRQMNGRISEVVNVEGCGSNVPVTGRYNFATLNFSRCLLDAQITQLEDNMRLQRVNFMAQMLDIHYRPEELDTPDKVKAKEQELQSRVVRSGFAYGDYLSAINPLPNPTPVSELVDPKLAGLKAALAEARRRLASFRGIVDQFNGADSIQQADLQRLVSNENWVRRAILESQIELWRGHGRLQLENMSWEMVEGPEGVSARSVDLTPDSVRLRNAIEDGPHSAERKRQLWERSQQVAEGFVRLQEGMNGILTRLRDAAPDADIGGISAAMGAAQTELQRLTEMYGAYFSAPQLFKSVADENSSILSGLKNLVAFLPNEVSKFFGADVLSEWRRGSLVPDITWVFARGINLATGGEQGWDWAGGYLRDREAMGRHEPILETTMDMLAAGDFRGAARKMAELDPDAWKNNMPVSITSGEENITEQMKASAALNKVQQTLTRVAKVHVYTGIAIDMALWSGVIALAAPRVLGILSRVSSMAAASAEASAARGASSAMSVFVREWSENMGRHFAQLYGSEERLLASWRAIRYTESFGTRFINAGAKMANFAAISGTLGGGMGWAMHKWDPSKSQFHSDWEAIETSASYSARWTVQSWHPLIMYVGIPSTAFRGSRLAESIANRGLLLTRIPGADKLTLALEEASHSSTWALAASRGWQILSMMDHFAKFMVISHGMGFLGEHLSHRLNWNDENDAYRRVQRSLETKRHWMEAPVWLLMPMPALRGYESAGPMMRSREGISQYEAQGRLVEIINAGHAEMGDPATLRLLQPPTVSWVTRLFQPWRWRAPVEDNTFLISAEEYVQALKRELPRQMARDPEFAGLKPGAGPLDVVTAWLRLASWDREAFGEIRRIGYEFRQAARELAMEQMLANLPAAERYLMAKPGTTIESPGSNRPVMVTRDAQQVLVELIGTAQQRASESWWPWSRYRAVRGLSPEASSHLAELMKPFRGTDEAADAAAHGMVRDLLALRRAGRYSEPFERFAREHMSERPAQLEQGAAPESLGTPRRQVEAAWAEFRRIEGTLRPVERQFLQSYFRYHGAEFERFGFFNRYSHVRRNLDDGLGALRREASAVGDRLSPAALDELAHIERTVDGHLASRRLGGNDQVVRDGETADTPGGYLNMFRGLKERVEGLSKAGGLSSYENALLSRALREVEGAWSLLKNPDGGIMPGWRPAQYRRVTESVFQWLKSASDEPRQAIQAPTSAGKTMIVIEYARRVLKAYAEITGGKPYYITRSEILKLQFEADARAMMINDLGITITTGSKFRAEMAEGKMRGRLGKKRVTIVDEGDAFQTETAVSMGESTEMIASQNPGYRRLRELSERLLERVDFAPQRLLGELRRQLDFQRALLERLPKAQREAALRQVEALTKILSEFSGLVLLGESAPLGPFLQRALSEGPAGRGPREIELAAQRLRAEEVSGQARNLLEGPLSGRAVGERMGPQIRELRDLLAEVRGGGSDPAALRARVEAIDAALLQAKTGLAYQRLMSGLERQERALTALAGESKTHLLEANQGMRRILASGPQGLEGALPSGNVPGWLSWTGERVGLRLGARSRARGELLDRLDSEVWLLNATPEAAGRDGFAGYAREQMIRIRGQITHELGENSPGWQGRVRRLLAERNEWLDHAATKQNPLYESHMRAYREVLDEAAPLKLHARVLRGIARRLGSEGREAAERLTAIARDIVGEARDIRPNWRARVQRMLGEAAELVVDHAPSGSLLDRAYRRSFERVARPEYELLAYENSPKAQTIYRVRAQEAMEGLPRLMREHAAALRRRAGADLAAEGAARRAEALPEAVRRLREGGSEPLDAELALQRRQAYDQLLERRKALEEARQDYQLSDPGRRMMLESNLRRSIREVEGLESQISSIDRRLGEQVSGRARTPASEAEGWALEALGRHADAGEFHVLTQSRRALTQLREEGLVELARARRDPSAKAEAERLSERVGRIESDVMDLNARLAAVEGRVMRGVLADLGLTRSAEYRLLEYTPQRAAQSYRGRLERMTRRYGEEWEALIWSDRFMPMYTRYEMRWKLRDPNWVAKRLVSLARSRFVDPAEVTWYRGQAAPKVTGETQLNLETEWRDGRRLEGRNDISLKEIRHESVSQSREVADSATMSLSGTDPAFLRRFQLARGYDYVGEGNPKVAPVDVQIYRGTRQQYQVVADRIRAAAGESHTLVLDFHPNSRSLQATRARLVREGVVEPNQISSIFSDTVFLRQNRPEARVDQQMRIGNIKNGTARVVLLDAEVASRGINLPLKGEPGVFSGWNRIVLVLENEFMMTAEDVLQSLGRVGGGRINPGTRIEVVSLSNSRAMLETPVLQRMWLDHPMFQALRENPPAALRARLDGRALTLEEAAAYIRDIDSAAAAAGGPRPALVLDYYRALNYWKAQAQEAVSGRRFEHAGMGPSAPPEGASSAR